MIASAANVTVVVYSGRPIPPPSTLSGESASKLAGATAYTADQLTLTTQPIIKPGGWILDATTIDGTNGPHGYFYRVTDVIDNGNGTWTLQLQTKLRVAITPNGNAGQIIVLDNVVEVFEKGVLYTP